MPGLAEFGAKVQQQFDDFQVERMQHGLDHWQHAFELHACGTDLPQQDGAINIVARGAELPGAARLLVFDDISEIVSAQRAQAWGEVARRLAHEIKNPLTPIQLSAERLEMKLSGKVAPPEQAVLVKSVKTIVDQVDAMKRLVNEFRDYARLPAADLKPVDLNALLTDVLQLYNAENAPIALRSNSTSAARPSAATRSRSARSSTTCCRTRRTPPKLPPAAPARRARSSSARGSAIRASACA